MARALSCRLLGQASGAAQLFFIGVYADEQSQVSTWLTARGAEVLYPLPPDHFVARASAKTVADLHAAFPAVTSVSREGIEQ